MAVYLVACEQHESSEESDLVQALGDLGAERILSSVFVVASTCDAQRLHGYLSDFLEGEDRIFVSRLTEDFSGYVRSEAGPWLESKRPL